jgi:integrase
MRKGTSQPTGEVGISRDGTGYRITAKVNGEQFEKRAKATDDQDADLKRLVPLRKSWIEQLKNTGTRAKAGTLGAAIQQHVSTFPMNSTRRNNAEWNLEPWKALHGERKMKEITSVLIARTLSGWRADGYAASTINHRRQELSNLFVTLKGRSGENPVRDTSRIAEVYDEPRGFPQLIVRLILKKIPDGPHKRRLRVLATTGLPPAQIVRLQKHDFNEKARTVFVRPRRKGAGVKGKTIPLTQRAVSALRDYFAANIKGWSQVRTREAFKAGVDAAMTAWNDCRPDQPWPAPPDLVVYDLRHAFLTYAYERTRDLRAVAELGLHADLKTTQRYTEAGVTETARKAVAQLK